MLKDALHRMEFDLNCNNVYFSSHALYVFWICLYQLDQFMQIKLLKKPNDAMQIVLLLYNLFKLNRLRYLSVIRRNTF